jgi:peptide/nickel transport system substrate-binding protein
VPRLEVGNVRRFLALVTSVILVALMAPAAVAQDDEEVVLTIGLTQPLDTLNVTAGFLVSEYEFWTLQYATLTDKAAEDFATIPGLAESWDVSDDGLTVTYTLREGLLWSDGEPLTADDVAWTINTSAEQEWLNHVATTGNLTATAIDDRTVEIVTAEPDPRLPTMDAYILPRHIWEPVASGTPRDLRTYPADDGVGSGPLVLDEHRPGEFLRLTANPNYWGGPIAVDTVIYRFFANPEAMVAALEAGELDAAHGIPSNAVEGLRENPEITVVEGHQGGFDEIAFNLGAGVGQPHPALLDLQFRTAIAHSIDKEGALEDILFGLGRPATTISPGADPKWIPELTEEEIFEYDPALANSILDEAGYLDTDGSGIREMPGGGEDIVLRHQVLADSPVATSIAEFLTGWLAEIGIGVTTESFDEGQMIEVIGRGDYDSFMWGWTPFVDPDPMLSYFTAALLPYEEDPSDYYNDANWTDPEYDRLYAEQHVDLDPESRVETVHEMLRIMHAAAGYIPLWYSPDLQAYRNDTFQGWVQQPAETGPVIFSNSSPSYVLLTPVSAEAPTDTGTDGTPAPGETAAPGDAEAAAGGGDDGGGIGTPLIIALVAAAVLGVAGVAFARRRRDTMDDRE